MNNNLQSNIKANSQVFEKYELIKNIGHGGMGAVYLVKNKQNNQFYALKYRMNDLNEANKTRFIAERKLLGKLNCRNIPKLIDYHESNSEQYYVMEYIDGITLHSKIHDNGYLQDKTAINYAMQIADAIGELHANGIIHRDIKSSNILVDKAQKIKVIDLGISLTKDSQRITKTDAIVCSPYYAAPEFATIKNNQITKAVDIYALGVVLYEMLIGKYPFEGQREQDTILMHKNNTFPDPKNLRDLPQALCNVILKATAKNPAYRHKNVWEFREDLRTCLSKERLFEKPLSQKTMKSKTTIVDIINSKAFLITSIIVIFIIIVVLISIIAINHGKI